MNDSSLLTCNRCKKEFSTVHNIKEHVINKHILEETNNDDSKLYPVIDSPSTVIITKNLDVKPLADKREHKKVKCLECGKYYSVNSLKENISNVHVSRSKNGADKKPSEEIIKFLTDLNSEFSGPEL